MWFACLSVEFAGWFVAVVVVCCVHGVAYFRFIGMKRDEKFMIMLYFAWNQISKIGHKLFLRCDKPFIGATLTTWFLISATFEQRAPIRMYACLCFQNTFLNGGWAECQLFRAMNGIYIHISENKNKIYDTNVPFQCHLQTNWDKLLWLYSIHVYRQLIANSEF